MSTLSLNSPSGWDRYTRTNIELDAVTGTPGIDRDAASAFGELPADSSEGGVFLSGPTTVQPTNAAAASAAAKKLVQSLNLLIDNGTARTAANTASKGCRQVVIQQQVAGADVVGASFKVSIARDGQFMLSGRPLGDLADRRPGGQPKATPKEAATAAAEAFGLDPAHVGEVELQVFPETQGGGRWTYRVSLIDDHESFADVRAYLDASDLSILLSYNIAAALTGTAAVYPVNPGRTPATKRIRLAELGPVPSDQVTGRRVAITTGMSDPLRNPLRNFVVATSGAGFDEPNAYYHIRRALRWFAGFAGTRRMPSPPFRPLRAIVRDPSSAGVASYSPSQGVLHLGDFGDRPSARSADIIYHELSHGISDMAAKLPRTVPNSQARGLSEGYSDYFSATMLDDPRFGEWVAPGRERDASNAALRFPPAFIGEEHVTGAVWAAMLWSLRQRLGAPTTDQLAFESLFLLTNGNTFRDARDALLSADRIRAGTGTNAGPNAVAIDEEWSKRQP